MSSSSLAGHCAGLTGKILPESQPGMAGMGPAPAALFGDSPSPEDGPRIRGRDRRTGTLCTAPNITPTANPSCRRLGGTGAGLSTPNPLIRAPANEAAVPVRGEPQQGSSAPWGSQEGAITETPIHH